MIVIMLIGGIGNQMFQYAFGRYLSLKYGIPLFINISIYEKGLSNRTFDLDIFNLDEDVIIGGEIALAKIVFGKRVKMISEAQFQYDEKILQEITHDLEEPGGTVLLIWGYWQSYKYFAPIESIIRRDFQFRRRPDHKWEVLRKRISAVNAVMVNVRRGDYLRKLDYHGVVSKEYLIGSIEHYRNILADPVFFVFSDGMEWCKENLSTIKNLYYVDEEYYDPKFEFYFQLMCSCKNFILANSSFCWWAAWLSTQATKQVIAPEIWFTEQALDTSDLTPPEWIRRR